MPEEQYIIAMIESLQKSVEQCATKESTEQLRVHFDEIKTQLRELSDKQKEMQEQLSHKTEHELRRIVAIQATILVAVLGSALGLVTSFILRSHS